ncbi:MAG: DUF3261 domain-containing protein [Azoarcus sp.]|jgi:hypothetical protein|nr:DUF3261 domain-containing protein [Azoarcus sp.]
MRACLTRRLLCVPIGVFCAFCLAACALPVSGDAVESAPPLRVAPALLGERVVEQRLVIRWPGGERGADAVLEIGEGRLRLVMLAFGVRLMSLEYDGETLAEQRFAPDAPDGGRVLNDLLLIVTPLEDLRRALPSGLEATERRAQGKKLRREIAGGAAKTVIDYETDSPWRGGVALRHIPPDYELFLESHEP